MGKGYYPVGDAEEELMRDPPVHPFVYIYKHYLRSWDKGTRVR